MLLTFTAEGGKIKGRSKKEPDASSQSSAGEENMINLTFACFRWLSVRSLRPSFWCVCNKVCVCNKLTKADCCADSKV